MRTLPENHRGFSTILALSLIPLSGFATDIYLPSLPAMARDLQVSNAAIQLSLVLFMFSKPDNKELYCPVINLKTFAAKNKLCFRGTGPACDPDDHHSCSR